MGPFCQPWDGVQIVSWWGFCGEPLTPRGLVLGRVLGHGQVGDLLALGDLASKPHFAGHAQDSASLLGRENLGEPHSHDVLGRDARLGHTLNHLASDVLVHDASLGHDSLAGLGQLSEHVVKNLVSRNQLGGIARVLDSLHGDDDGVLAGHGVGLGHFWYLLVPRGAWLFRAPLLIINILSLASPVNTVHRHFSTVHPAKFWDHSPTFSYHSPLAS